jgi:hypothetical protein
MRLRSVDQVAQPSSAMITTVLRGDLAQPSSAVIATVLTGDVAQPPSAVIGSLPTLESASVAEPAPDGN